MAVDLFLMNSFSSSSCPLPKLNEYTDAFLTFFGVLEADPPKLLALARVEGGFRRLEVTGVLLFDDEIFLDVRLLFLGELDGDFSD